MSFTPNWVLLEQVKTSGFLTHVGTEQLNSNKIQGFVLDSLWRQVIIPNDLLTDKADNG